MARQGTTSLYICAAVFFFGTLNGVVMIAVRELPPISGIGILVTATMAIYCFRMPRKIDAREKK